MSPSATTNPIELPAGRVRVIPMGIPVTNASIWAMDDQFDTIPLGSGTGLIDCIGLGIGETRSALAVFALPGPTVSMGNHVNWLGHFRFLSCAPQC